MQLLESVLGSKNSIRILRYLSTHENWEFNITELAKDININKGVLSRLIKILKDNNIIKVNQKGKIILFKINKDNLLIKNLIIPIFKNENSIFDEYIKPRILKLISKNMLSIILYGSYARGDFKLTSDLDLLLIVKSKDNKFQIKVNKLKEEFLGEDILVRIDIMILKEFKRLYRLREPLIISIEKNHKILYGNNFNELIK